METKKMFHRTWVCHLANLVHFSLNFFHVLFYFLHPYNDLSSSLITLLVAPFNFGFSSI